MCASRGLGAAAAPPGWSAKKTVLREPRLRPESGCMARRGAAREAVGQRRGWAQIRARSRAVTPGGGTGRRMARLGGEAVA